MKTSTSELRDVTIQGEFQSSACHIEANSYMFDLLSRDTYKFLERAVVREYVCNAVDANIEAGQEPYDIIIHLPTILEPYYSVKDKGFGLNDQMIRNVFVAYGASTKRDSNQQIGKFGIGAKSGFAIDDSFSIVSCHKGQKKTYSVYRDENGIPQCVILKTEDTEDSGIEIRIETGKVAEFAKEAANFFKYWDKLPSINSQDVLHKIKEFKDSYILKSGDWAFNSTHGKPVAIMGGVPYEIPCHVDFEREGWIDFEIGELDIPASRETLQLTDKTKNALNARFKKIKSEIGDKLARDIDAEPTFFKKCLKFRQINLTGLGKYANWSKSYKLPTLDDSITKWHKGHRDSITSTKVHTIEMQSIPPLVYIFKEKMNARVRQQVRVLNQPIYVMNDEQAKLLCVDPEFILDMDTLPKVSRKPQSPISKVRTFELIDSNPYKPNKAWKKVDLNLNQKFIYVEIQRSKPASGFTQIQRAERFFGKRMPKIYGVKTSLCKTKKFRASNGIPFDIWMRNQLSQYSDTTIQVFDDKNQFENYLEFQEISKLIQKGIDSKELCAILTAAGIEFNRDSKTIGNRVDRVYKKYPLFSKMVNSYLFKKKDIQQYIELVANAAS